METYLTVLHRRVVVVRAWLQILQHVHRMKWKKIKKWRWRVKPRTRPKKRVLRRKQGRYSSLSYKKLFVFYYLFIYFVFQQGSRNRLGILDLDGFDIYEETGLFYEQFEELLHAIGPSLRLPRAVVSPHRIVSTSLTPAARLLLLLCYFREAGTFRRLVNIFHVSKAFISRDITHILPKLHCALDAIHWPDRWVPAHFKGTSPLSLTAHHTFEGEFIRSRVTGTVAINMDTL